MTLREMILSEHTKQNCNRIVSWVGNDKKRFNQLFELFLADEYRVTQRAAWPLSYCAIAHPSLMNNNFERLVANLRKSNLHDAVKRNTVRLLQEIDIPKNMKALLWKYVSTILNHLLRLLPSKHFL